MWQRASPSRSSRMRSVSSRMANTRFVPWRASAIATCLSSARSVREGASGVVLFAHGSGSSRFSPRNQAVARQLQANGMATLLFDLPHEHESRDRRTVFHIDLLSTRLTEAVDWVSTQQSTRELAIGLFGASTGSAAALTTAIRRPAQVAAIVSWRPARLGGPPRTGSGPHASDCRWVGRQRCRTEPGRPGQANLHCAAGDRARRDPSVCRTGDARAGRPSSNRLVSSPFANSLEEPSDVS